MDPLPDTRANDLADGEEELPARNNTATKLHRRDLGKVKWHSVGDDTDTTTEDETTDSEQTTD